MLELIYGGAASGKSEFGEKEALSLPGPVYYLATMRQGSASGEDRIEKHKRRRENTPFITIECPVDIESVKEKVRGGTVLLECLTNLAANELFPEQGSCMSGDDYGGIRAGIISEKIGNEIDTLAGCAANLVIVSGDVMRDGVCYGRETESYMRLLAGLNSLIARRADRVYEVIYSCVKRII